VAGRSGVRWFTPAASEYRRELDAWCATVGSPVTHEPPTSVIAAPPHPISPVPRIVLVSWNVHVGGGDIAALVRDLRSGRLTTGEVLPFVLLLQEAFRMRDDVPALGNKQPAAPRISPRPPSGRRVSTPDLAKQLGLHAFYVPSMRNGRGSGDDREDRGCAILSTLPLNELHAVELPFERQRRVAVAARIDDVAGQDDLWLVDVHLENRTGARRVWLESPAARARQARALLKKFLPDGPAVLGGDLNTWASNEPTIELLKDVFDTPVGEDPRETLPRVGRIDYLLARLPSGWAMISRRLDNRYGSDHYPVLGVLTLPETSSASQAAR
jgi:endonuclease/exonuclease/phosphatase family metal-dependent hydrolase